MLKRFCFVLLSLFVAVPLLAQPVSLSSLLDEMVDRDAVTRFPDPAFLCLQSSSYDRASTTPDDPNTWFANADTAQFIRDEMNGDRKEWVLMDAEGPGAIVRWWITAPHYRTTFRIYLDGNTTPAIEAPIGELIGGDFLVGAPLSAEKARGRNLYLPIPYAKSCKVTVDNMPTQGNLYYIINHRAYAEGTAVESFTMDGFKSLKEKIDSVQETLNAAGEEFTDISEGRTVSVPKGGSSVSLFARGNVAGDRQRGVLRRPAPRTAASGGAGVLQQIVLKVDAEGEALAQALRSTVLAISFDGKETVWCPLGDFFGSGVGVNPYKSWYTRVTEDGTLISLWKMPFRRAVNVRLINYGDADVKVAVKSIETAPYQWDDRSMYFHANWWQERRIDAIGGRGTVDWNYLTLKGRGIFVGDVLVLLNRNPAWWGEGDEKIYVDGETFPSHFGTGTEDYYGYAWCTPAFFEAPFHFQPRAEGPHNYGNVTNARTRSLDGIPFNKDFRFDMEVWHWASTKIDYAVATFWYGFDGIEVVDFQARRDQITEARAPVLYNTPMSLEIPGFKIEKIPTGGNVQVQNMGPFVNNGEWEDNDQLWWIGARPNSRLELILETEKDGKFKLVVAMTKARDYGIVQFHINGEKIGEPIDLYNSDVIPTGAIELGTVDLKAGRHAVEVEILGKNEQSAGTYVGIDTLTLVP